jgi:hypothetical protein
VRRGLAMVRNIIVVFTVVRNLAVCGRLEGRRAPEWARVVGFAISVKRQAKHAIPGRWPAEPTNGM